MENKNAGLVIEKLNLSHLEQVYQIEELSFVTPWSRNSIKSEIVNKLGRYIVIMDGTKVVAYGGFWIVLDEANVNNIAVHPDYRGQGISKLLMRTLVDMAGNEMAKHMYLEVRSSNSIAQKLYRSFGFVMINIRKGYYTDTDEDAIVMMKEL